MILELPLYLKQFLAVFETRKMRSPEPLSVLRGAIECQQPIEDLYSFTGRITLKQQSIPPQFQVCTLIVAVECRFTVDVNLILGLHTRPELHSTLL